MAGRILVSPEQLDSVSREFKTGAEQSQALVQKLQQQVNGMQGQWDGMTQQRFFQQFQEASNNMKNFVQVLNGISQELTAIATRFRQADGQN